MKWLVKPLALPGFWIAIGLATVAIVTIDGLIRPILDFEALKLLVLGWLLALAIALSILWVFGWMDIGTDKDIIDPWEKQKPPPEPQPNQLEKPEHFLDRVAYEYWVEIQKKQAGRL